MDKAEPVEVPTSAARTSTKPSFPGRVSGDEGGDDLYETWVPVARIGKTGVKYFRFLGNGVGTLATGEGIRGTRIHIPDLKRTYDIPDEALGPWTNESADCSRA